MLQPIPPAGGGASPPSDPSTSAYAARLGDTVESILERFKLNDPQDRRAFFELNPRLAGGGLITPGQIIWMPVTERPVDSTASPARQPIETTWTNGFGRDVAGQNAYNDAIRQAQIRWPGVDPLILKSILAQETGFRESTFASNPYGYAGVAQLGIAEAHEAGLRTGASRTRRGAGGPMYDRANDERFDPAKAIPAAAVVLRNKETALQDGTGAGAKSRLHGYRFYGEPRGDERWRFAAAAYNGGQGTILRAMRHAYGSTPPAEIRWTDMVRSPTGNIRDSPLWKAIVEVGMNPAVKYREISEYAANVVARARQ